MFVCLWILGLAGSLGPEDVAPTEDRDDTAETDDETGEKAPIPLRPLRGWRDRS